MAALIRRILRRLRDDTGAITAETLVVLPILALMIFAVVQFALWGIALIGARAAADAASRDGAAYGATSSDAYQSASTRLHAIAGRLITDPRVQVDTTATTVTVVIHGRCPLLPLPVTWSATTPRERFTSP